MFTNIPAIHHHTRSTNIVMRNLSNRQHHQRRRSGSTVSMTIAQVYLCVNDRIAHKRFLIDLCSTQTSSDFSWMGCEYYADLNWFAEPLRIGHQSIFFDFDVNPCHSFSHTTRFWPLFGHRTPTPHALALVLVVEARIQTQAARMAHRLRRNAFQHQCCWWWYAQLVIGTRRELELHAQTTKRCKVAHAHTALNTKSIVHIVDQLH